MRCLPPSSSSHPTTLRLPLLVSQREGRARPSPRKAHPGSLPAVVGGCLHLHERPGSGDAELLPSRGPWGHPPGRATAAAFRAAPGTRVPGGVSRPADPSPSTAVTTRASWVGSAPQGPRGRGPGRRMSLCSATPGHAVFRVLATPRCPRACPPGHRTLPLLHSDVARAGAAARGPTPRVGPGSRGGGRQGLLAEAPLPVSSVRLRRGLWHTALSGAPRTRDQPGEWGAWAWGAWAWGSRRQCRHETVISPAEWNCVVIKLNATRLTRSLACLCRSPGFHGCLGGTCSLLGAREGVAGELQRRFRPGLSGRHPTRPHPRCPEGTHADRAPDHTRCMSPAQPPAKAPAVRPAPQLRASRPHVLLKEEPRTRVSSREKLIRF